MSTHRTTEYIIVRQVKTDELRIVRVMVGYRPTIIAGDDYTWGGPFGSYKAAREALRNRDEFTRKQLYPA